MENKPVAYSIVFDEDKSLAMHILINIAWEAIDSNANSSRERIMREPKKEEMLKLIEEHYEKMHAFKWCRDNSCTYAEDKKGLSQGES